MARIPIPEYNTRETAASGPFLDANAQGGRLGNYMGNALEGASQAVGQVADVMERRDNDQAYAWASGAASRFKLDQYKAFQDARDAAANSDSGPDTGDGLTGTYLKGYDAHASELLEQAPTARARKYLTTHIDTFRTQMGETAMREQYTLGKQYLITSSTQGVEDSAHLIGDPGGDRSQMANELGAHLDSINRLQLPPDVRQKMADDTKRTLTSAYWTAMVRDDPQGAATLLRGQQPLTADGSSPQEMIRAQASKAGVDPRVALAIAKMENDSFDPGRPNGAGSSAKGLFQIIDSTWGELGGSAADRNDAGKQAELGVKNLAQNQRALKDTLKRDITPGELYSTQWGLGFASALAKAPDNTPVIRIFANAKVGNPDRAMEQNNLPDSMTAGQLRAAFNTSMAQAMAKTQGMADAPAAGMAPPTPRDANARAALDATPIPQQLAYLTHAESMARRDDSQQRAALEGRINDTLSAYNNFEQAPNPPQLPELVATYGPVKGAQEYAKLTDMQQRAYVGASYATMPTAQIQASLAAAKPAPGEGYANKAQAYARQHAVATDILRARFEDPLGTDQSIGSHITKPVNWANDQSLMGEMAARYAGATQVSEDSGTAYTPLTKSDVVNLATTIDQLPPVDAMRKLAILRAAAGNDIGKYGAVMGQIAKDHPATAIAGMLADTNPAAANFILTGDRILNPSKSEKGAEGKTPNLLMPETALFRNDWAQTHGAAFQGLDDDARAHFNAAMAYYVGALPAGERAVYAKSFKSDLWEQAKNAVAPQAQDLTGAKVLIPSGYPAAQFQDAVARAWPGTLAAYGLNPAEYPAEGYSLRSTGQDGVYQAYNGAGVALVANNQRVTLNLTDQPLQASGVTVPGALARMPTRGRGAGR